MSEFYNVEQGSEVWFMLRCGRITASNFKDMFSKPSTLGFKKLVNNCVFEKLTGQLPDFYKSDWMKRGNEVEPQAIDWYSENSLYDVTNGGFFSKGDIFGASPDAMVGTKGALEIKCPSPHIYIEYLESGKLPSIYKWQVHGQMNVCDLEWVDFLNYHPAHRPKVFRVERDEKIDNELNAQMMLVENIVLEKLEKLKGSFNG